MITQLLYLILFTSLTVLACKIVTAKGMLLEEIGAYAEEQIEKGNKAFDMIYCEWCLPTLCTFVGWGFMFVLEVVPFEWNYKYIAMHLLCVFASSLLSGLTWTSYTTMNARKEYYEAAGKYYENAEKLTFFDIKDRKEKFNSKKSFGNGVKSN